MTGQVLKKVPGAYRDEKMFPYALCFPEIILYICNAYQRWAKFA